ncbi:MAG: cellulase family glycosylhydrolase [Bacteroidota bacterium]
MSSTASGQKTAFVHVQGSQLIRAGKPYYFLGTNFWYGMNLGSTGEAGDRKRLIQELDQLAELGVTNLRIMGASEGTEDQPWQLLPTLQAEPGKWDSNQWEGLDFLLAEMAKREMLAVVCLNNFWPWSGGMAQYVKWESRKAIPYPPPAEGGDWARYQLYAASFFRNEGAMQAYEAMIRALLTRINSLTGIPYREDPTIMAWELANEPRGIQNPRAYRAWIARSAQLIKQVDPNHLLTIGSEGWTPSRLAGTHFKKDHRIPGIDYATLHIWIQNWGWYDPLRPEETYEAGLKKAKKYLKRHLRQAEAMGMPVVLEEFGIARDQDDHDPAASVNWRDRYYQDMFEEVLNWSRKGKALAGCNFWAWGGQGRPRNPKAIWQKGDDFIGDPPHEYQGWYSVYDQDASTLEILKTYARRLEELQP